MEEIVIKKQRQMTFSETFEFCVSSIRHRFMRSILTLCVVILAVAFFMYLQCTNIFRNSVKGKVEQELFESRKPTRVLKILYAPCSETDFVKLVADYRKTPQEMKRLQKVIRFSDGEMKRLSDGAFAELTYLNFFDELTIGRRKELFDRLEGRARLEYLSNPVKREKAQEKMLELGGIHVPGGWEKFSAFLDSYIESGAGKSNGDPKYRTLMTRAYNGWLALQDKIRVPGLQQDDSSQVRKYILLEAQDPAKLTAWQKKLNAAGYEMSDAEVRELIQNQHITEMLEHIQAVLLKHDYRVKWRRAYGQNQYNKMEEKLAHLDDKKTKKFMIGAELDICSVCGHDVEATKMVKDKESGKMVPSPEPEYCPFCSKGKKAAEKTQLVRVLLAESEIDAAAKEFRSRENLRTLELQLDIDSLKDSGGFSPSQLYLMCLSFLVCVVGITNAMLMSITERFREIATLKCLGATDSFILVQIVLEALIQGIIGGLVGLLLGFIVALVNSSFMVGLRIFQSFNWEMIGLAALASLLAGILLSVLSSLYPSTKAARMAPMEAMRVE